MASVNHRAQGVLAGRLGPGSPLLLRGLTRGKRPAQRIALTVATAFVLLGLGCVLLTDVLLYRFAHDDVLIARIETAKGWTFVGLAGALMYLVTLRSASRLARARRLTSAIVESIADGVLLLGPDR